MKLLKYNKWVMGNVFEKKICKIPRIKDVADRLIEHQKVKTQKKD